MLRLAESGDHYTTRASMELGGKWTYLTTNTVTLGVAASGRHGTAAIRLAHNSGFFGRTFGAPQGTWIVGLATACEYGCSGHELVSFWDGATEQCWLTINSVTRKLSIGRGVTVLATGNAVLPIGILTHVEIKVVIHGSAGTVEVRVNGVTDTPLTLTGQDLTQTANNNADGIRFGEQRNVDYEQRWQAYEDITICDGTGAQNNDFLGDNRVQARFGTAAGAVTQWTPNAGADWDRVDDVDPDGDTTYIESSGIGNRDTYVTQDISPAAGAVKGVQIVLIARKDDAGVKSIAPVIRHGGVNYDGTPVPLATAYSMYPEVFELNPGTGVAFTVADVNAMEIGVKDAA